MHLQLCVYLPQLAFAGSSSLQPVFDFDIPKVSLETWVCTGGEKGLDCVQRVPDLNWRTSPVLLVSLFFGGRLAARTDCVGKRTQHTRTICSQGTLQEVLFFQILVFDST